MRGFRWLQRLATIRGSGIGVGWAGIGVALVIFVIDALNVKLSHDVLYLLLALGVLAIVGGLSGPPIAAAIAKRELGEASEASLRAECQEVTQGIWRLLERDQPTFRPARSSEAWEAATQSYIADSGALMRRFDADFGGRALWLYDELTRRGIEMGDRFDFEHPTNPLGIREVAQRLEVGCLQLGGQM